ncbi:MAG: PRC-barrel domain-containing protein [Actinobacteria bacterium]|nr:PRC-barrel domain-containing protein [Actinomycetota bacterium]
MDEQQLSWLAIEPGWSVVSSDGSEVGHVEQVVGDSDEDIFNGLSISTSFFEDPRYVPSERVGRIFDDRVELLFTSEEVERLDEFLEPPPSVDVDAEQASWSDRVLEGVTDIDARPRDVPSWKRVRPWLASLFRR